MRLCGGMPGIESDGSFLRGTSDLLVPAKTRVVLLLDQGHLTNAFTVLETSGGAGSTIRLVYTEALKDAKGNKGNRNEIEGKTIAGVRDEFRPDGGAHRRFETLWFRTYRFVQMEIETGDEALRVHDLHGIFVGYPFKLAARFDSDLAWLADMWEINWRGARLCAWETYFDTPYYEQLQYVGDTRIQGLITLYMSDDDRLVRQAIEHFDLSRIPEGITASRYPSDLGQYIPTFSPIWVAMVHDYWMHRDAPSTCAASFRGSVRSSAGSRDGSTKLACSVRSPGGHLWTGPKGGTGESPRAAARGTPRLFRCSSSTRSNALPNWRGGSA